MIPCIPLKGKPGIRMGSKIGALKYLLKADPGESPLLRGLGDEKKSRRNLTPLIPLKGKAGIRMASKIWGVEIFTES